MPIGKTVQYAGHKATFLADIFEIESVYVIRASGPVNNETMNRSELDFEEADYHLNDFPGPSWFRPDIGVFVVPKKQLTNLKEKSKKGQRR